MTNDTRTSDDIERDIVEERAQLSKTINDLQKKFSVDAIMNDVGAMFRDQGGELGRKVRDTVGQNPAAVILVGVGLAWLFLGHDRKDPARSNGQSDRETRSRRAGLASTRWDHESLPSDRFSGGLRHAAPNQTQQPSDGLEGLSEEARSRVPTARRAAHDDRRSSETAIKKASSAVSNLFEDQPLVVGALALALGAALGSAQPRSRFEDDAMGKSSDQLFAAAQAVFREERDKAMAALKTGGNEAKGEIKDIKSDLESLLPRDKSVSDEVVDRASDVVRRL